MTWLRVNLMRGLVLVCVNRRPRVLPLVVLINGLHKGRVTCYGRLLSLQFGPLASFIYGVMSIGVINVRNKAIVTYGVTRSTSKSFICLTNLRGLCGNSLGNGTNHLATLVILNIRDFSLLARRLLRG